MSMDTKRALGAVVLVTVIAAPFLKLVGLL